MKALKIYPEIYKWRAKKSGLCQISIRIDYNGCRIGTIGLDHSIDLKYWDSQKRKVLDSHPAGEMINLLIDRELQTHQNYFIKRQVMCLPVTKEYIKKYIRYGGLAQSCRLKLKGYK